MKKLLFVSIGLLWMLQVFSQKQFVIDADAEMRTVEGDFNSIRVSGGIDIYISQSDEVAVAVSASKDKFRDGVKTVVKNGELQVYYDNEAAWKISDKKLVVYIAFRNLEKIQASGASDIIVAGTINVPSLRLDMSGASDFKGAVSVALLTLHLSGASDVSISGTATTLNIQSSGASDVKGYGLSADICSAHASGASDIHVTVNKELSAHASGASKILYKGLAVVKESHNSGASTIAKRG